MGNVIPFPSRVTRATEPNRRRMARMSGLTPERLTSILECADRGELLDWADLCDKMSFQDAHVRCEYITRLAAVGGARWELTPGRTGIPERDAVAEQAANFCRDRLENLRGDPEDPNTRGFDDAVMDLLDGTGVGLAVQEIDWKYSGQWWAPENLRWVHARRFRFGPQWDIRLVDDGNGRTNHEGVPLSKWPRKFITHTPRERGGNQSVTGILRPVSWLYLFRRWVLEYWVQGTEQHALPGLVGEVPRGAPAEVRAAMDEALEAFGHDRRAVVEAGGAIRLVESIVKDGGMFTGLNSALEKGVSKAILGSVDQSQPSEIGAWKAVESRKGTTVVTRQALDARQMSRTLESQLLTPLLEFNTHLFNGVLPAIPRIRFQIAEERKEIPAHLLATGAFTRNEIRRSMGYEPIGGMDDTVSGPSLAPV